MKGRAGLNGRRPGHTPSRPVPTAGREPPTDNVGQEGENIMSKANSQTKPKRRRVVFYCDAPEAKNVAVVGTFNDWDPHRHPMRHSGGGRWNKALILPPGNYEYKFWVDGCWQEDPRNGHKVPNSYGTANNLLAVRLD